MLNYDVLLAACGGFDGLRLLRTGADTKIDQGATETGDYLVDPESKEPYAH